MFADARRWPWMGRGYSVDHQWRAHARDRAAFGIGSREIKHHHPMAHLRVVKRLRNTVDLSCWVHLRTHSPRPLSSIDATTERCEDTNGRVEAGKDVSQRKTGFCRRTSGIAGDRHRPRHCLNQEVVACPGGIRAILPETGYGSID